MNWDFDRKHFIFMNWQCTQVEAERKKRAAILESEGIRSLQIVFRLGHYRFMVWYWGVSIINVTFFRSAEINVAEGRKQSAILKSEAEKAQLINEAEGQVYIIMPSMLNLRFTASMFGLNFHDWQWLSRLALWLLLGRQEQRVCRQLLKLLEEPRLSDIASKIWLVKNCYIVHCFVISVKISANSMFH